MKRFILLIVSFLFVSPLYADEVMLKNGDHMTGTLSKSESGFLILDTDYAGTVKIKLQQVACIITETEMVVVKTDGTRLEGRLGCKKPDTSQVVLSMADQTIDLGPEEIKAVGPVSAPPPKITYKGNINGGASFSGGNTDSQTANAAVKWIARTDRHRVTTSAKVNYGETDGKTTAENIAGALKYDFFFARKMFIYGQTLLEKDKLKDLDLRTTMGGGAGYQFFENRIWNLYGEAGISHVREEFKQSEDQEFASGRWSVGLNWQIVPDRIKFFHFHEGYLSLEDTDAYVIRSEQGFRLPLIKNFFANFQADIDYTNTPAVGKDHTDTTFIMGLTYEFAY